MTGRVGRRRDIDWLRALAVYLLVVYHSARPFDDVDWHVKDDDRVGAADLLVGGINPWHMPLLFLLAGWSIAPSLESRGTADLMRERRRRLLVPLAFGCVALMPPLAYLEARHKGETGEAFLEYLPRFFTSLDEFTWMHLWFLAYLYAFTALYLPALRRLHAREWTVKEVPPWAIYTAIVPFAAVQIALRGRWPGYQNLYDDWANFTYYSLFFIAGFLLARHPAIEQAVHRERLRAACLAATALIAMVWLREGMPATGSPEWIALQALSAVAGVTAVMAALGYGAKLLAGRERGLAAARTSAMPVYVVHQPIILALAVPVVALPVGVPLKFALLLGASSAATLGVYGVARRSRLLMRLLGAKPRGPSPSGGASRSSRRAGRTRERLRLATRRS